MGVSNVISNPVVVRVFAVIGFLFTLLFILGILGAMELGFSSTEPSKPDKIILTIDFDRPIVEQFSPSPFDLASNSEPLQLLDVLHAIDNAKHDSHVKGIVAHFGGGQPSMAKTQEIVAALNEFRKTKKFAYAFGTSYGEFGNGNRSYLLASAFDKIWLQPVGSVSLTNAGMEAPFGKTALNKLGIDAEFMRREEYKSFPETFTRDDFSEPVRKDMQALLDSLNEQVSTGVAEGRKWELSKVKSLMDRGPFTASEALKLGLVTHIGHYDELMKEIDKDVGNDAESVKIDDYLAFGDDMKSEPKATVALIYGTGAIADHGSATMDVTGETVMGADTVSEAFNDAADDTDVKAIIFRVDSPGGSPEASETIRAALLRAQQKGKPVFISMGDLAASGGYWVSMSADYIVAEPGTITGSIGVLAGKFVFSGFMQKFGIGWDHIATGPNANMWSVSHNFTPFERERMDAFLDETYHEFINGVAKGRKIPPEKMANLAKGRVYTGVDAKKVGLVDELGGFSTTLAAVKKKLNLQPNDIVSVQQFPVPLSTTERIFKILKNVSSEGAMVRSGFTDWKKIQAALGPILSAANNNGHATIRVAPEVARAAGR